MKKDIRQIEINNDIYNINVDDVVYKNIYSIISQNVSYNSDDLENLYFNSGTMTVRSDNSLYASITIFLLKDITYNYNNSALANCSYFKNYPKVSDTGTFLTYKTNHEFSIEENGYVMFTFKVSDFSTFTLMGGISGNLTTIENKISYIEPYVNEHDKHLREYESIDISTPQYGFYNIFENNITFVARSTFISVLFDASENDYIIFNSAIGGVSAASIIAYDSSNKMIEYYNKGVSEYETVLTQHQYKAPKNCSKIAFTSLNIDNDNIYCKISKNYIYVDNINDDIYNLKNNFIINTESKNLWNGKTVSGCITTNGSIQIVGTNSLSTKYIPVKPNYYYYISGRNGDITSLRIITQDNKSEKIINAATGEAHPNYYYLYNENNEPVLNGQFKTPSNAKYVQISISMNTGTKTYVMLEEIGTEYVSDFIPSIYENPSEEVLNPQKYKSISSLREIPLKILLIGSSHGMNVISQFPWIAYKSNLNVIVGNLYKGSLSLKQISDAIINDTNIGGNFKVFEDGTWNTLNTTHLRDLLLFDNWDYISIQRSASEDETWTLEQSESLDIILEYIKSNVSYIPKIIFMSGFADPRTDKNDIINSSNTILQTAKEMQAEYQLDIIPISTAIQNARNTSLSTLGNYTLHNLCYDSQHLDYGIGCYVAGACLFEFLYRNRGISILTTNQYGSYSEQKTFVGDVIDTNGTSNAYTEPTPETMKIAKYCAIAAVNNMNEYSSKLAEKYS